MLCVLWFKWAPENTSRFLELWKEFQILKITFPFREIGVPHIAPALPLEESPEMMERM